tara:strand:- start:1062 stop:1535 length:474 start_codon:yes stop_codon:yes gene_type:complete
MQPVLVKENPHNGSCVTMKDAKDKNGKKIKLGTIRVSQAVVTVVRGYVNVSNRSAFLTLREEQLAVLAPLLGKDQPFPVPGKLVITETLTPYVSKSTGKTQEPKQYPKDHKLAGQPITYQGQPVYMNTDFESDMSKQDVFLREAPVAALPSGDDTPE